MAAIIFPAVVFDVHAAIVSANLGGPGFTAVVADYDGDGKADPAVYQESSGNWFVAQSSNRYILATINLGGPGYKPVAGDYDRDGKAERPATGSCVCPAAPMNLAY